MAKIIEYFKETKGEMQHVSWPTRKQALGYTVAVVIISVAVSLYLAFFDTIFSYLLDVFLLK